MEHTDRCQKRYQDSILERKNWQKVWPHACKSCGSEGWIHWEENGAPFGEGYWSMPVSDLCEDCLGMYKCPRCGQEVFESEDYEDITDAEERLWNNWLESEQPCPHCGWSHGQNKDDYAPLVWECFGECIEVENIRKGD